MTILLLLILALMPAQTPETAIFDTIVTKVKDGAVTITWSPTNNLTIPADKWAEYKEWPAKVNKGQLLKATFDEFGNLQSVAGCEVRLRQAQVRHTDGMGGKTPTNSLMPRDCSQPTDPFIDKLLRRLNRSTS